MMKKSFLLFVLVLIAVLAISQADIYSEPMEVIGGPVYLETIDMDAFLPDLENMTFFDDAYYSGERPEDENVTAADLYESDETIAVPVNAGRQFSTFISTNGDLIKESSEFSLDLDEEEEYQPTSTIRTSTTNGIRSGTATGGFRSSTTSTVVSGGRSGTTGGGFRGDTSISTPVNDPVLTSIRATSTSRTRAFGFTDVPGGFRGTVIVPSNPPAVTGQPLPYLSTSLNLNALSTALRQIISPVLSSLNNKWWTVRSSWPHVEVGILNVTLNGIQISTANGRISVRLTLSCAAQVYVRTKLAGSARSTISVSDYTVSASAGVSLNSSQKLQVYGISVTGSLSDVNIHTTGGLVMKFILKVAATLLKVKSLIRNALTCDVPAALANALTTVSVNAINTIPWKLPLGGFGAAISLAIVEQPILQNNQITVAFNGRTINPSTGQPFPHTAPSRPVNNHYLSPSGELFSVLIDQTVFNDFSETWLAVKGTNILYTRSTQPNWLKVLNSVFWHTFFPQLEENYPSADLTLRILAASAPHVEFTQNHATFSSVFDATFSIDNNGTPSVDLVTIRCSISAGLLLKIEYDNANRVYIVKPDLDGIDFEIQSLHSIVGSPKLDSLNETFRIITNYVLLPQISFLLAAGVPIPGTVNMALVNPSFSFLPGNALIRSSIDIRF